MERWADGLPRSFDCALHCLELALFLEALDPFCMVMLGVALPDPAVAPALERIRVDADGQVDVTDVKPTAHAVSMSNVMRDDVPLPSLANEKALQNAPEQADGYFKVPKVIQD